MHTQRISTDRRAELKARHHEAILDAADALIRERGTPRFSVDELAERADVARRTVFNHFSSLDGVIMTTCTRHLSRAVDEFRAATASSPAGDGGRIALFEEITAAIRAMDLPALVAYFARVLAEEGSTARSHNALESVFLLTTQQFSVELAGRSVLDEFEVAVLVSSLMNGVAVVARHWIERTGAALDASSRQVWDDLLDRLVSDLRRGYSLPD